MRADTKKKHEMGKRFAILIGVAAAGVMALGAQTGAAASEGVVSYGTKLTIYKDYAELHGEVNSKVRKCTEGREVILFRKRPGPDRKLGAITSGPQWESHNWRVSVKGLKTSGRRSAACTPRRRPRWAMGSSAAPATRGSSWTALATQKKNQLTPRHGLASGRRRRSAGGESVDSTPPDLQLSGPKKQSPQNACCHRSDPSCSACICSHQPCDVDVQVSCGDEVCTVRAKGKLTNVKMDKLDPDSRHADRSWSRVDRVKDNVGPELAKDTQRKQVRQALADGENVQAKVTVKATDAAGNVATAKRTITLVK